MIKNLVKRIFLLFYNRIHNTKIKSLRASLHAKYGKGVLIDRGTVVDRDVCIGDYSYVNRNSSVENCEIGKYCSISSGVYICPFEHDLAAVSTHPAFHAVGNPAARRRPVLIGNDVLISLNAIILEGIKIGNGAVIAAGAVVTKDVEPYEIVGGVPARHIGYRFSKNDIRQLEESRWWDWSSEMIEKNNGCFSDIQSFLTEITGKSEKETEK